MKPTYIALDSTGQAIEPGQHQAVRVEHPLLAAPVIWTAQRSEKRLTWPQAKAWAESLTINGWSWRLPTVEEAFLLCDRTRQDPVVDKAFFPDCTGEYIWTGTECAWNSGAAWNVGLGGGNSDWYFRGYDYHVRAVRAGQF